MVITSSVFMQFPPPRPAQTRGPSGLWNKYSILIRRGSGIHPPRADPTATASASASAKVADSDRKAPKSTSGTTSAAGARRLWDEVVTPLRRTLIAAPLGAGVLAIGVLSLRGLTLRRRLALRAAAAAGPVAAGPIAVPAAAVALIPARMGPTMLGLAMGR